MENDRIEFDEKIINQPIDIKSVDADSEVKNSALHFFLHLISFFSLTFISIGSGIILYQIINKNFPDELGSGYSYLEIFSQSAVKFGVAAIIIAGPTFFIASYFIVKYLYLGNINENSKVRKWTTYIILFIAVATILGDLIHLVFSWLGGGMTSRFVLKVFVDLFIAGSISGYYFWDMRRKNIIGIKYILNKIAAIILALVLLVVFASAFSIIDSPSTSRNKKSDAVIVEDMTTYKYSIEAYAQKNKELPLTLDDLYRDDNYLLSKIKNKIITYGKTDSYSYQLCADFKTSNIIDSKDTAATYKDSFEKKWQHDKGHKCFDLETSYKPKFSGTEVIPENTYNTPSQTVPAVVSQPTTQPSDSQNIANQNNDNVTIIFTLKNKEGKLLKGVTCDLMTNSKDNSKMATFLSKTSDDSGVCKFDKLSSLNPWLVAIYWSNDRSLTSHVSLSFLKPNTTESRTIIRP